MIPTIPCRHCLFQSVPFGCPEDEHSVCNELSHFRKFIPREIEWATYNYNSTEPEKANFLAVYELMSKTGPNETWFHCYRTLDEVFNEGDTLLDWAITVFDRSGKVVLRHFPITRRR